MNNTNKLEEFAYRLSLKNFKGCLEMAKNSPEEITIQHLILAWDLQAYHLCGDLIDSQPLIANQDSYEALWLKGYYSLCKALLPKNKDLASYKNYQLAHGKNKLDICDTMLKLQPSLKKLVKR